MKFVVIRLVPIALLPCLMLGPVHAERSDREKPVNIEADRMSLDDLRKESIFEGNVVLTQGTLTLKADRITVKQDQQGFSLGIALGKPASFRQKREGADEFIEGFGDRVEYDGKGEKVQLFTNARIKRGEDEVKGDYISYNSVTEFYEVIGTKGATTANSGQRVKAVIQPKKKNTDPVSGAPKQ